MLTDEKIRELLLKAIYDAEKALNLNNYPIGSLITDTEGNILASDMNQLTSQNDITAHAEILCIRKLGNKISSDNSGEYYMFSSLEPCFGCSFFIARTNIKKIYSVLKDPHKGGMSDLQKQDQFKKFFSGIEIINDQFKDLRNKSKELMKNFFLKIGKPETAAFYGNKLD